MDIVEDTFKIITFNLRKDSKLDRRNSWKYRKQLVSDFIRESGAVIVGVQELMPAMKHDMMAMLENYRLFGKGRCKKICNEHADILVNNDVTEVDFSKTIWLSKHPEKLGSRAFLAVFPRICTICEVKFRDSGKKLRVFNAHFDHVSKWARKIGVDMILRYMDKFQEKDPMPTVLMGDFNVQPDSRLIGELRSNIHSHQGIRLVDAYDYCNGDHTTSTYHGFRGIGTRCLDYIFVSDDLQIVNTYVDRSRINGRFLSDHYPMIATLGFKKDQKSLCI